MGNMGNMPFRQQVSYIFKFFSHFFQAAMANIGNLGNMASIQQVKDMFKYFHNVSQAAMGNMGTMNNIGAIQQVKSFFLFISSTLFLGCHGQPGHGQCGTERVDPVV